MKNQAKCVLCGKTENNIGIKFVALPFSKTGKCCIYCKRDVVIPKNMELLKKARERLENWEIEQSCNA